MGEQQQKQSTELSIDSELHIAPVTAASSYSSSSPSVTEGEKDFSIDLSEEFDILDVVRERQSNPNATGIMSGKDVEEQKKDSLRGIVATQQCPCKKKKTTTGNEHEPEEFNILDVVRKRASLTGMTETEIESQTDNGANAISGQQHNRMTIGSAGAHRTMSSNSREASFISDTTRTTQPGAYSDAPGEELQWRSKVPFSLVGSATEISCNDGRAGGQVLAEGTLEEDHPKSRVWCKRKPVIVATLLVVIIAVMILIVLVLQSNSSSESETTEQPQPQQQQNQQKDTEATMEEERIRLVPNMTNATLMALEDPSSQQSQAYAWIAKDPDWDTYEDWRKQQRFAMMCFYYAFGGSGGSGNSHVVARRFNPTHHSHECDWLLSFDACAGNDRDEIIKIGMVQVHSITFRGTMPPEIAFLSNLEAIEFRNDLDFPNLEDMFPLNAISSLPPIKSLKFNECQMGGSIPSTLGLLTSLTSLELPGTSLGSTIPSQLGLLSDLTTLTLSSNGLTGSIPEAIGDLPSLINLDIRNNPDLEAPTPSGFCSDDHIPFESLVTDWCFSLDECCRK